MKKSFKLLSLAVVSSMVLPVAKAQTITNPDFEDQTVSNPPGYILDAAPTGWSIYVPDGVSDNGQYGTGTYALQGSGVGKGTGAGNQFLFFLNASYGYGEETSVYQDLGALQPDTTYTLTFAGGVNSTDAGDVEEVATFYNGTDPSGQIVALTDNILKPSANGTLQDYTVSFTTDSSASGDLTLGFQNLGITNGFEGTNNGQQVAIFDNLRLSEVSTDVPEPGTYAMFLGGLGALVLMFRQRKSAA